MNNNTTNIKKENNSGGEVSANSGEFSSRVLDLLNRFGKRVKFSIFSPGGNDTCLVEGIVETPSMKKKINDSIMKLYPNVEQVGFIDLDSEVPRLEMAGGEFCGNATRSFIFKYFNGKPGKGQFKISGVDKPLFGGIEQNGESWAEMPIYENPNSIEVSDNKNFVVNMEGISHYIYYTEESEFNKDDKKFSEKLKEKSMKLIKSLGLDILPAAGVIYVYKKGEDFYIEPVVYVKSIDTLFYETACGSGTTALGMAEALKNENSVNDLSVYQPSGKVIKISVDYDNNNGLFKKAIIKGPVDELVAGDLEQDSNYSVESCNGNSSILESGLNFGLINLYKDCFKGYPYFELFTDEKIKDIFKTYNDRGDIYFAKDKGEVIGFSAFVDLEGEKEIVDVLASYIRNKGWILGKCKYVADLGVKEEFRNNNIGRILILEIIKELSSGDILIMRTSENNYKSWNLFKSLGFEKIKGVEQQTLSKRQDGQITTDTRIFSFYIKK